MTSTTLPASRDVAETWPTGSLQKTTQKEKKRKTRSQTGTGTGRRGQRGRYRSTSGTTSGCGSARISCSDASWCWSSSSCAGRAAISSCDSASTRTIAADASATFCDPQASPFGTGRGFTAGGGAASTLRRCRPAPATLRAPSNGLKTKRWPHNPTRSPRSHVFFLGARFRFTFLDGCSLPSATKS